MHFDALLAAVVHHRHVGSDDRRDSGLCGSVDDAAHVVHVAVVDEGVHREVGLHTVLIAGLGNLAQVFDVEVVGAVGTHVKLSDAEVDRVGTSLQSCGQRLA